MKVSLKKLQKKKVSQNLLLNPREVGEIEKHHEERYRALLHNVEMQEVFR